MNSTDFTIRRFAPPDLPRLREITTGTFQGVSIDGNIEKQFGLLPQSDWRKRKLASIDDDCRLAPDSVFVAPPPY